MSGKKPSDPKKALTKQVQADIQNQLNRQRNDNGLNADGFKTLVESSYLIMDLLNNIIHSDDIDLSANLIAKNKDGSINIKKTDALYNNVADFYDRYVEPGWQKYIDANPGHSNDWYASRLDNCTNAGALHNVFSVMLNSVMMELEDADKEKIVSSYKLKHKKSYDLGLSLVIQNKRKQLALKKDPDGNDISKQRALIDELKNKNDLKIYEYEINKKEDGKWNDDQDWQEVKEDDADFKTYMAEQKELNKTERKLESRDKEVATYQFLKKADFSYITDEALKKTLAEKVGNGFYNYNKNRSNISEAEYQENKELFKKLDKLQKDIKSAKPWFNWLRPSKKYEALKKSVTDLRKALQKGDTSGNRSALREAYEAVERARETYAGKYPGRSKTLMTELRDFNTTHIEHLDQRILKHQEMKSALNAHTQALRDEKERTMNPEQNERYRHNVSVLTALGANCHQRENSRKIEPFSLADAILHPEKYEKEAVKTLKEWDEGVKQSAPEILECSGLKGQMDYIQKAFSSIDLEKEALRYLDIKETDKEKISQILKDPENRSKLEPFYDAVAEIVDTYESNTFKAVRYDMKEDSGRQNTNANQQDPEAGFYKLKNSLKTLRQSEKELINVSTMSERNSINRITRKTIGINSEKQQSENSISIGGKK